MIEAAALCSGQDGGVGEISFTSLHNQKKETTILKTKNNQNFQKLELYGSTTTKKVKKKHSSRLVGGTEKEAGLERTLSKAMAGSWRTRWSHIHMHINWEELWRSKTDCTTQGSSVGK